MLKIFYFLLSTFLGALISVFLIWSFIVLFFPSLDIDKAFNILVVIFVIGGISGFLFYYRKSHKYDKKEKT
jgi:membrane protein DedA with SNARE-associated domain